MRRKFEMTHTRHRPEPDALDIFLSRFTPEPHGFGHQRCDPLAVCSTRIIGDFELILVNGGETRVRVGNGEVILQGGTCMLIPPFQPHAIETPPDNPHDNYWIHFDVGPAHLQPKFLTAVRPGCCRCIEVEDPACWQRLFACYEDVLETDSPGKQTRFQALLLQLLVLLLKDLAHAGCHIELESSDGGMGNPTGTSPTTTSPSARSRLVRACTEAVLADLRRNWTAPDMALLDHVSVSTLQKAFAAELGMPPHQFLLFSRVRRAEMLLLTAGQSLEDIACAVGFSSAHALHAAFRRVYGMSPREWRKQLD